MSKPNQKPTTTLCIEVKYERRAGNTTRIVDTAVQLLFDGLLIQAEDHWQRGDHWEANKNLFGRIIRRMQREHPGNPIEFDSNELQIWLRD